MNTLSRYGHYFYRKHNFCNHLFAFQYMYTKREDVYSEGVNQLSWEQILHLYPWEMKKG